RSGAFRPALEVNARGGGNNLSSSKTDSIFVSATFAPFPAVSERSSNNPRGAHCGDESAATAGGACPQALFWRSTRLPCSGISLLEQTMRTTAGTWRLWGTLAAQLRLLAVLCVLCIAGCSRGSAPVPVLSSGCLPLGNREAQVSIVSPDSG